MVIHVKDHVASCDTNEQGDIILHLLYNALESEEVVTLDFHGVLYATTSFINSAIVPLLDELTFEDVKKRLRLVKVHPHIGNVIRQRMSSEAGKVAA